MYLDERRLSPEESEHVGHHVAADDHRHRDQEPAREEGSYSHKKVHLIGSTEVRHKREQENTIPEKTQSLIKIRDKLQGYNVDKKYAFKGH